MKAIVIFNVLALSFYAGLVLYCWHDWTRRKRERSEHTEMMRRLRS